MTHRSTEPPATPATSTPVPSRAEWDEWTASSTSFTPSTSFWDDVVQSGLHRPRVFRSLLDAPLLTEREFLQALISALNPPTTLQPVRSILAAPRLHRGEGSLRIYADGRAVFGWPDDALYRIPRVDTVEELLAYTSSNLRASTFAILVKDLPEYFRPLWFRCRDFIQGLIDRIGMPASHLHSGLFCGTYEHTPFGIHRDPSSGFMFGLHGVKEIWVWPHDYFQNRSVRRLGEFVIGDPREHEAGAIRMRLEPGDVAYWPASYWHVGMGEGGAFHACATIGMWESRDIAREVGSLVTRQTRSQLGDAATVRGYIGSAPPLPADFVDRGLIDFDATAFRDAGADFRRRQASAAGFLIRPALVQHRIPTQVDEIRGRYPLLLHPVESLEVAFANGYRIPVRDPGAAELLRRLDTRVWFPIKDARALSPTLVQQLANIGAVAVR